MREIPHIGNMNGKKVLIVNGEPLIILGGEVHNSNSSSAEYMEAVWKKAEKLGMNTLLLPVTWEMTEPEEGVFDFRLVDELIVQARERNMKIVFLWFGAWKNAQCHYAPPWVKTDLARFCRAEMEKGKNFVKLTEFHGMDYTSLSYLCEETKKADANAFSKLLAYIRDIDRDQQTVIMVQVENETGVMGAAREQSNLADRIFAELVPEEFVSYMRTHTSSMAEDVRTAVEQGKTKGSWKEVFGDTAEEIFSAYHIASYVNYVAEAGKKEYPIPMAVNCWLDKGEKPGLYPSGGPVARMMEVWQYAAPAIDMIGPDIYIPDFCGTCEAYQKNGNPLFIPETATHAYAGPRQVYVVGHYHGLCFAPFGFEEMGEPFSNVQAYLFGVDTEDPALVTPQDTEEYGWYNRALSQMMPLLTERYGTEDLQAVLSERTEESVMDFGNWRVLTVMNSPMLKRKDGVCLALKISEDEFYLLANGCGIKFLSGDPEKPNVDYLLLEEGDFRNGIWHAQRRINGDETASLIYESPVLLHVKLFAYR